MTQPKLPPGEFEHLARALDQHAIVSITDVAGRITYVNDKFCEISGYRADELLGQNHRIIKSGLHPDSLYAEMWRTISSGQTWHGEICNRRRNGEKYWVASTIVPCLDAKQRPYQYVSIRTDITAQKNTEEQLRRSQRCMAEAQQIARVGSWEWDIAADRLTWSDEIYRIFELDPESFGANYQTFMDAVHPDDRDRVKASEQRAFEGQGHDVEHRIVLKDGAIKWVHERAQVSFDADGKPILMTGTVQDITERKQVEERLEISERRLRLGQTYANIGTWDWDIQTGELHWSERIAPLFGYPKGNLETTYENFLNAVHPDDRQRVIDAVNACVDTGAEYNIEHRIAWPDGSLRWAQERGDVMRTADGKPQRMIGVVQDITDRKIAEQARERLLAILEASPDFIASGYPGGNLFFLNKAGRRMLGIPDDADISALPIGYGHPEWAQKIVFERGLPTAARDGLWIGESTMLDGQGREFPIRQLIISHKSPSGEVEYYSTVIISLIEQKRAENELILAKEAAERANQAKSDFLSSMSHELRTPLNAILGFGQLLESDPSEPLSAGQKESLNQIIKAGWHLLSLINEVLDLAKIEAGHIDLSIETVELGGIIQECLSLTAPLADQRGIHISMPTLPTPQIVAKADRTRLKQILLNLLSNAVKYNRENGEITVQVERRAGGKLRIAVSDTGQGLQPEQLADLFQAFHRLGAERSNIEGTGIGLVISKRIVELMGGAIGADSRPGVGSTFWIELDEPSPFEQTHAPEKKPEQPPSTTEHAFQHAVLYVEDNPANLTLLSQILGKRSDIRLITAHTGALGLDFALAHRPDLILLDINLPGMDGYEIKARLEAQEATRRIPVLAISANAMQSDVEKGLAAGFAAYITKPIDVRKLLTAIDHALQATSNKKPGQPGEEYPQ